MTDTGESRAGCFLLGAVSLVASVLGSALAALIFCASQVSLREVPDSSALVVSLFVAPWIVFYFGIIVAIPTGLVLGVPMLAGSRWLLPRYTLPVTLVFALVGLLGGEAFSRLSGSVTFEHAELFFGPCVGGMHPLVYSRAKGTAWPRLLLTLLVSAVAVTAVALIAEDTQNLIASRETFEERCRDPDTVLISVADRAEVERPGDRLPDPGKWLNQRQWRSLYQREGRYPLDATHVLIAYDYAYVPGGVAGWITGGRRVERHCLSERTGRSASLLQRFGFGNRPSLSDLAD